MYLRECLFENVGPIESPLDLTLPFNEDGTPQPLVLVGVNGSGKSIFLSYIVDALTELAKIAYSDIVSGQQPMYSPYFKSVGPLNQRVGSDFGIGLLQFSNKDTVYSYVDKTGNLDPAGYTEKRRGRFETVQHWPPIENYKRVAPEDKKAFEDLFRNNSICYFPPSRKEFPHWLNRDSLEQQVRFVVKQKIAGELGKPIFIESSVQENKSWLLDVFLDSLMDFMRIGNQVVSTSNINEKFLLKQSRINVDALLKQVLQDDSAMLIINNRNNINYRLCIAKENQIAIPSLDHLSSGQSILFNMFATIIRYADKGDINKSIALKDIEGIVVIDEIDAHLHTNLQYEVLPKLIKLFPKVQFIMTTHSPLFLLGLEKEYENEDSGYQIIEMPKGHPISTERFSEFKKSFEYYQKTKAFDDEVEATLQSRTKPLVLTEGETDPVYIKTAIELLGENSLLEKIDIEWVGAKKKGQAFNTGNKALDQTNSVLEANPVFLKHKLLLLYDCDTNKQEVTEGNIYIRKIPINNSNIKIKKGIENLLVMCLFDGTLYSEGKEKFFRRFYPEKILDGDYGERKSIQEFDKTEFCNWVCMERKNPSDFANFKVIVSIFKDFINDTLSNTASGE